MFREILEKAKNCNIGDEISIPPMEYSDWKIIKKLLTECGFFVDEYSFFDDDTLQFIEIRNIYLISKIKLNKVLKEKV